MRNLSLFFHSKPVAEILFSDSQHPDKLIGYDEKFISEINSNFYENFYASGESPLKKTREIQFQGIVDVLKNRLPHGTSGKIKLLDVGCGRGDFCQFITEKLGNLIEAFGIEPSLKHETSNVKKLGLEEVRTNEKIPKQYDILTMLDVFEHFKDPDQCLSSINNLLADDGLLVLKVPNKDSLLYRLGKLFRYFIPSLSRILLSRLYQVGYPPPHFHYYNASSLIAILKSQYQVQFVGYQSEMPPQGLMTRFWGIKGVFKYLAIVLGFIYWLLSPYRFNDSLLIIAKKSK